jgi:integrase
MNALVFLYKKVLDEPLEGVINAVRAPRKVNVPVVMTREEVARVIPFLNGVPQLVVKLLYGSGLRMMEALRMRVQDIDFQMKTITVRSRQGGQRSRNNLPCFGHAALEKPPGAGQSDA